MAAAADVQVQTPPREARVEPTSNDKSPAEQKTPKQHKMMDVNTDEVTVVSSLEQEETPGKTGAPLPSATPETGNSSSDGMKNGEAVPVAEGEEVQVLDKKKEGE